jgi:hypothetical protein
MVACQQEQRLDPWAVRRSWGQLYFGGRCYAEIQRHTSFGPLQSPRAIRPGCRSSDSPSNGKQEGMYIGEEPSAAANIPPSTCARKAEWKGSTGGSVIGAAPGTMLQACKPSSQTVVERGGKRLRTDERRCCKHVRGVPGVPGVPFGELLSF